MICFFEIIIFSFKTKIELNKTITRSINKLCEHVDFFRPHNKIKNSRYKNLRSIANVRTQM